MGSLARTVETENREPRSESSQLRQELVLRNGDSASGFHPGYSFDSGNRRGQTISSKPVLRSLLVPLVLLRPRHRTRWIHPHLLSKTRRLHSCNNHESPKHRDHRAPRPSLTPPLNSNTHNPNSHPFIPSPRYL